MQGLILKFVRDGVLLASYVWLWVVITWLMATKGSKAAHAYIDQINRRIDWLNKIN